VTYTAEFVSNTTLEIVYLVSPAILGDKIEQLGVILEDTSAFVSHKNIEMVNEYLFELYFETLEASEEEETAGSGATVMLIATLAVSIGVSLVTGGSMELMWSLTNTLQIVFICGLLDLYYPSVLIMTFEFLRYSNFEIPGKEIIAGFIFQFVDFVPNPVGTKFDELGFGSTNILVNSLPQVFAISGLFGGLLLFYLLQC
jgi:hypothetical protein